MHAIIMAGGEGQRLRPLSCISPKPLIPVLGRPVMAYTLELAARHGVREIHVTLGYQPERIEEAFGCAWGGMRIDYHRERTPLGTAGSVREAARDWKETFFVLSGDALTDCDLSGALSFHRRTGALATLVLKKCEKPLEYGVVVTDQAGRIERFIEKPDWEEAIGDWVNTGIYILEPEALRFIPQGRAYDFGRELFPLLIRQGLPVYGYAMQGYWCDVGDVHAYVQACADMLDGKVKLECGYEADETGNLLAPDACVSESAQLVAPCYIGPGAQIAPGAVIGPHTVVEAHAHVLRGAHVKRSIVMENARIGAHATLSGAIAGRGAQAQTRSALREGCVLGEGAVLEEEAELTRGARVWPQKRIEAGRRVEEDVVWGDCLHARVRGDVLEVASLQEAIQGACAWARLCGANSVALMHSGGGQAKQQLSGAAAQLNADGVRCFDLGSGSEAMLRVQARMLDAQAGIFFKKRRMVLLDAHQCPPSRAQRRALELSRPGAAAQGKSGETIRVRGAKEYYLAHLCRAADRAALREMQPYAVIACPKKAQEKCVRALLAQLGLENVRVCAGRHAQVRSYETGFFLDADGKSVKIADSRGVFSEPNRELLAVLALIDRGESPIVLSARAPQAAQALCASAGVPCTTVREGGAGYAQALSQHTAQKDFHEDGLYALVCLLSFFVRARMIPRALLEAHVHDAFCEQEIDCARTRIGRVLCAISTELHAPWESGAVSAHTQNGCVTLYAPEQQGRIHILTQSRDMETAQELCDCMAARVNEQIRALGGARKAQRDETSSTSDLHGFPS